MKSSGTVFPVLVFLSVILAAAAAESSSYPERLRSSDRRQQDPEQWMTEKCDRDCLQYHESLQEHGICRRRCLRRVQGEREGGRRGREEEAALMELQQCQQKCRAEQRHGLAEEIQCEFQCEEEYRRRHQSGGGRRGHGGEGGRSVNRRRRGDEGEKEKRGFVFDRESFRHRVESDHGSVRVLERFTRLSNLLRGIDDYRLAVLDVEPSTFVVPNHWDADVVLYVAHGRGNINLISDEHDKKESHGIRSGDVLRVPAGTVVYIVNNEDTHKLTILTLIRTASTPGQFKEFYGAGGRDPPSFYRIFSNDLLEAAFNADGEKIERLFGKQKQGPFVKATPEQLGGIGREESSHWPFGGGSGDSYRPFNLLDKRPTSSNSYGKLRDVDGNDYRKLKDLDVMVSFLNITNRSMMAPFYNTRSTTISLVVRGTGYIEMACPHRPISRRSSPQEVAEEEEDDENRMEYRKIESNLRPGKAFVVLTGHPIITVSTGDENLEVLTFVIRAEKNQMHFLAGKNNVLNQLEDEAKELSFDRPADEVNRVFESQDLEVFFPGPEARSHDHGGRRQRPIASILDFAGF